MIEYKRFSTAIFCMIMPMVASGCCKQATPTPRLPQSLISNLMKTCDSGMPPATVVFRVYIGDPPVQGATISGPVAFASPILTNGSDDETKEEAADDLQPAAAAMNNWYQPGNYPFHVDLTDAKAVSKTDKTAMIRVVLPNNYSFLVTSPTKKTINGTAVGEDPSLSNLCKTATQIDSSKKSQTAIFYATIGSPPTNQQGQKGANPEPFNIVFQANSTNDTPIIIDPKVHQPGS